MELGRPSPNSTIGVVGVWKCQNTRVCSCSALIIDLSRYFCSELGEIGRLCTPPESMRYNWASTATGRKHDAHLLFLQGFCSLHGHVQARQDPPAPKFPDESGARLCSLYAEVGPFREKARNLFLQGVLSFCWHLRPHRVLPARKVFENWSLVLHLQIVSGTCTETTILKSQNNCT